MLDMISEHYYVYCTPPFLNLLASEAQLDNFRGHIRDINRINSLKSKQL